MFFVTFVVQSSRHLQLLCSFQVRIKGRFRIPIQIDQAPGGFGGAVGRAALPAAFLVFPTVEECADDVLAVRHVAGTWTAYPAYPTLRLWPASERLLFGTDGELPPLTPSWDKRGLAACVAGQMPGRIATHPARWQQGLTPALARSGRCRHRRPPYAGARPLITDDRPPVGDARRSSRPLTLDPKPQRDRSATDQGAVAASTRQPSPRPTVQRSGEGWHDESDDTTSRAGPFKKRS